MKQRDITIGKVYAMKVSGKLAPVRVDRTYRNFRNRVQFYGTNLRTNRMIGPFTSSRCRWEIVEVQPGCYRAVKDLENA